eukprot:6981569-Ditylum_brightwellii.AAC.1
MSCLIFQLDFFFVVDHIDFALLTLLNIFEYLLLRNLSQLVDCGLVDQGLRKVRFVKLAADNDGNDGAAHKATDNDGAADDGVVENDSADKNGVAADDGVVKNDVTDNYGVVYESVDNDGMA